MNTACSFCSRFDVELYTDGSSSICRVCATSAADRFGLPIIPLETIARAFDAHVTPLHLFHGLAGHDVARLLRAGDEETCRTAARLFVGYGAALCGGEVKLDRGVAINARVSAASALVEARRQSEEAERRLARIEPTRATDHERASKAVLAAAERLAEAERAHETAVALERSFCVTPAAH